MEHDDGRSFPRYRYPGAVPTYLHALRLRHEASMPGDAALWPQSL